MFHYLFSLLMMHVQSVQVLIDSSFAFKRRPRRPPKNPLSSQSNIEIEVQVPKIDVQVFGSKNMSIGVDIQGYTTICTRCICCIHRSFGPTGLSLFIIILLEFMRDERNGPKAQEKMLERKIFKTTIF